MKGLSMEGGFSVRRRRCRVTCEGVVNGGRV